MIVGIGASAGGLAVLKKFVQSLPDKTDMAFVVIQHLDPTHKSLLGELLDKETSLSVQNAEDGTRIEVDHIYVIPPDTYLEVDNGKLKLIKPEVRRGFRKAIDHFFRSLANECANHCAGIVLSGAGSDGTAGLRAIKATGGLALAQDPDTAEHDSMPLSAVQAEVIDKIARVEEMFTILKQFADHPLTFAAEEKDADQPAENIEEITALLKTFEDFNLQQYKPSTVQRRITRRMSLSNIQHYRDYLEKLRKEEGERKLLTKDLLINVTDFFRDPEAFKVLEKRIIPELVEKLGKKEDIRVWISGCASGEEAYSIAILLLEAKAKFKIKNNIKIFATDIDEVAIKIARRGIYPDSITSEVPKEFLEKYFFQLENDHHYRINNKVRDLISFAVQNVATDPPFNHMHLISCRNLLIYFKKEIQEKVLGSFFFALENDAYLFLGSSETIGNKGHLFKSLSKKWRIYQKMPGKNETKVLLEHLQFDHLKVQTPKRITRKVRSRDLPSRAELIRRAVLETFLPPGVVVDTEGRILYNHGNWKTYLSIPTGEPRFEITQLILPELRSRLRSALYKVRKTNEPVRFLGVLKENENQETKKYVEVELSPILDRNISEEPIIGIIFHEVPEISAAQRENISRDDETKANQNLEQELAETKEELQNTIEELETSSEELKASHEEALSTNEELQSANEELEASAEELRSLNEELSTVNAQLKDKIDQLQSAQNDIENFFASTNVPTIFLDPGLEIQSYTPAAENLLKMGPKDIGRPIHSLGRDLVDDKLAKECTQVLQDFHPIRKEIRTYDKKWFIRQITPYRTEERRIEGVVVVFQDVTEIKELSQRAESREQQQAVVAKLGLMALGGAEPEAIFHQAVRQVAHTLKVEFCKVLKYQPKENNFLLVSGIGWEESSVGKRIIPAGQDSQAGFTLVTNQPVIVSDLSKEKRFSGPDLLTDHHVTSGISCTINHSDPPYGVIGVHTKEQREFNIDDANFLLSVANMLSTAIRAKETQKKLQENRERLDMARSAAKIGIHDHDIRTNTVKWDSVIRRIWGVPEELEPITYEIFSKGLHPEDRLPTKTRIEAALAGKNGGDLRIRYRVISEPDRGLKWIEATGKTVFENGEPVRMVGTVQDITTQVIARQDLARSEEKLRLALKTNKFGSFEFYLQKEQTEWDPILGQIWGLRKGESPTQDIFWEGIHPEDTTLVRNQLAAAVDPEGKGSYFAVYRVVNRLDKHISWVEASGQTIFQNGVPVKMVGMIIDVTERKELENSLQSAVKELQEADKQKNDFLSILGHELRNPLTALKAAVEIFQKRSSEADSLFPIMKRSLDTMAKLLDDLLDLNRISKDMINLNIDHVNLSDTLAYSVSITENLRKNKEQNIIAKIADDLYVEGDMSRLEQVFANLLVNASKFSPEGGETELIARQSNGQITVSVYNTGIGLDQETMEKVFAPFFQVKQEGQAASGLGIGLALSKKLVELHRGTITVRSEGLGQGATFTVVLPAQVGGTSLHKDPDALKKLKVAPGLKIVLVEDNEDLLSMMPLLLKPLDAEIRTASNGKAGLELAQEFQPDAMIIDIGLPDLNGYEVAGMLRENGYQGMLIALSGYSHQEARRKSTDAGFDHHLAKPANIEEIAHLLSHIS